MSVAQLTSMGFPQEDAEKALACHSTIEEALEYLLSAETTADPAAEESPPTDTGSSFVVVPEKLPEAFGEPSADEAEHSDDTVSAVEPEVEAAAEPEAEEVQPEPSEAQAPKDATPLDRAQMFFSQSMSAVRAHVSSQRRAATVPEATEEAVNGDSSDVDDQETPEAEAAEDNSSNENVARWSEIAQKLRTSSEAQSSGSADATCAPAAAAADPEAAEEEVEAPEAERSEADADQPENPETAGAEEDDQKTGVDAVLLDRAQVLMSKSLSALRSQISGLRKPAAVPSSTADGAAADMATSDAVSEEPAAHAPVFSGSATEDQAQVMEDTSDNSPAEMEEPISDEAPKTASKWNDMASKLSEARADEHAETEEASSSSAAADGAERSAEDHEPALANATTLDRMQVAFSMFNSAVRSRVSALRTPEVVAAH